MTAQTLRGDVAVLVPAAGMGVRLGVGLTREIIDSAIGAIILLLVVRLIRTGGRF